MNDPLGYETPLPLLARCYPLGYPLIVETNEPRILQLAESLWSRWPARHGVRAAQFRIAVAGKNSSRALVAPAPGPRGQAHLVSIVHGPDNFAVCDVRQSFAFASLTCDVAADAEYTRYHFLEPLTYLMIDAAHLAPIHASCIAWNGCAVVLCGDSGAGKTSLAYACARLGWTYLSDDATHIIRGRSDPWVLGRPFRIRFRESARKIFPELEAFPVRQRANGKFDIEVETHLLNLMVATESPVGSIVFLERTGGAGAALLEDYPRPLAASLLQELVCHGDPMIQREQRCAFEAFLRLPVYRLRYQDAVSAEAVLRELAQSTVRAA